MNIIFDQETKEALEKQLAFSNKSAIRLGVDGFSWGGPILGVAMDEQQEDDDVFLIDGLKFVSDDDISFLFEDAKLVHRKGLFRDSFSIISKQNGSCN